MVRVRIFRYLWLALSRLESAIAGQFPGLTETAKQTQAGIYAGMAGKAQKSAPSILSRGHPAPPPDFCRPNRKCQK